MENLEAEIYRHYLSLIPRDHRPESGDAMAVQFEILARHYDSFLFDGFGTLYNHGGHVYPGALESLQYLRAHGKNVRLLTNAASRPVYALQKELQDMGVEFSVDEIISSGDLLPLLNTALRIDNAFYLGKPEGLAFLHEAGITPSETPRSSTVILSLAVHDNDERLLAAETILREPRARLVVLNPDAWAPRPDGTRIPVSGAQAYKLQQATGCQTLYCGKPFPLLFEVALRSLIPSTGSVLMIGDTLGTDIAGATLAGIDSALIVGRNTPTQTLRDDQYLLGIRPTYLLESLSL